MTTIFHQLGHRDCWNFAFVKETKSDHGFVISPKHKSFDDIEKLDKTILSKSIFDPQFYLPSTTKGKLSEYPFFPSRILSNFKTTEWGAKESALCAKMCIGFQVFHDFKYVVIPTRLIDKQSSQYIDDQKEFCVDAFLNEIRQLTLSKPVLLQVILSDGMLKNKPFVSELLNWITSVDEVRGVYLIPYFDSRNKILDDSDGILAVMDFIKSIRKNDMDIIVGYSNLEALCYGAADPTGITIGSYENVRIFNEDNFDDKNQPKPYQPNARFYVSRLLQLIDNRYIKTILEKVPEGEAFFDRSNYFDSCFEETYKWHFTKPEPYKHYFEVFSSQIDMISALSYNIRRDYVIRLCNDALAEYRKLASLHIVFDHVNSDYHLPMWINALSKFQP